MSKQPTVHEANDTKLIEIHTRLFFFNQEIANNLEEVPEFISIYNDSGEVIGAGCLELDEFGVKAILTFDYHSPERLSIELDDGYKYYAHPQFTKDCKKLLFVLINTNKPEDKNIEYLRV